MHPTKAGVVRDIIFRGERALLFPNGEHLRIQLKDEVYSHVECENILVVNVIGFYNVSVYGPRLDNYKQDAKPLAFLPIEVPNYCVTVTERYLPAFHDDRVKNLGRLENTIWSYTPYPAVAHLLPDGIQVSFKWYTEWKHFFMMTAEVVEVVAAAYFAKGEYFVEAKFKDVYAKYLFKIEFEDFTIDGQVVQVVYPYLIARDIPGDPILYCIKKGRMKRLTEKVSELAYLKSVGDQVLLVDGDSELTIDFLEREKLQEHFETLSGAKRKKNETSS